MTHFLTAVKMHNFKITLYLVAAQKGFRILILEKCYKNFGHCNLFIGTKLECLSQGKPFQFN
jgi:hypothetical protein